VKEQLVTLDIGEDELVFQPTEVEYNDYMNELMPDNKVAPAHNFLFNCVKEESKDALRKITDANPAAAVQITAAVMAEYAPQLVIKVKK
jgi:Phage tail assembly chaperone